MASKEGGMNIRYLEYRLRLQGIPTSSKLTAHLTTTPRTVNNSSSNSPLYPSKIDVHAPIRLNMGVPLAPAPAPAFTSSRVNPGQTCIVLPRSIIFLLTKRMCHSEEPLSIRTIILSHRRLVREHGS